MTEPTFWRAEIWHPLTLHFPITLLLVATVVMVVVLFLSGDKKIFWQKVGSYSLYAGCLAAWVAIYTGDMADGIVSRKICDPTVLKSHENAAFNLAYLFTAATALTLSLNIINLYHKTLRILVVLLMIAGTYYLVETGHKGAQVVYEQGGGVNMPASDCAGY
ncbi:DUF2231 domain-containing protein [Pontibacter cellulosilyticus]|uniref:DUF2231 domain-containing protein n=1 Tax=Pontibacter cellulosilyticus TaxID=1720253 RepID=A0A923SLI5_9BACT|nr:DUF2231 domain-containing protein [Pontibacter cellulosilyticus]MBC5994916.1 hypothetical protein [Pontibacter cellulosilyticus]